MRFADMHMCQDLVAAAHSYIEQYFTDVVASEEFLQLEARQVIDFIASDQLTVPSEEKVSFFIFICGCRSNTTQKGVDWTLTLPIILFKASVNVFILLYIFTMA